MWHAKNISEDTQEMPYDMQKYKYTSINYNMIRAWSSIFNY